MVLIINYIITFLVISLYVVNMTHIYNTLSNSLPWFQRFKINLWLKAAIDSSSRANQFELGSDPDSVS